MTEKRVILITGTSRGIGSFLAKHYLATNNIVIGCSRTDDTSIKHSSYIHFKLDITDELACKGLFRQIKKTAGRLDVLINNAGIASMNHVMLTPLRSAENILRTNILGTFLFSREAAKLMKAQGGGNIINFSTVAVPLKLKGEAIYAASKAAVVNLTQTMSKELADWGIRVNAVGPTPISTDLIKAVPKEKIEELISQQALKRMGEFSDVVNVVDFFIDQRSNFITGQVIYLGGIHQ
jgi:3-oxoacyl-[acyl-carrier protein] reductase